MLFRHDDLLGSLRFLTNGSQAVTGNLLSDAFGEAVSASGSLPSPFGFIGESGCQTDADTGLVLMGHRYYDTRIGRFISQDPAGSGDNWYAYAGNDPVDNTDPSGLVMEGSSPVGSPGYMGAGGGGNGFGEDDSESYEHNQQVTQNIADHTTAMLNAISSAGLISINAGAPVITKHGKNGKTGNYILSMGYGAEILLGTHKYGLSAGVAIDLSKRRLEVVGTFGSYNGIGLGSTTGPYIGLGVGTLGGYNGLSSG